jgi:hypothetical protein
VCARFNVLWAPASRHSRATTWFGELRSPSLPQKACLDRIIVLSPCSRRYRQYKLRSKTHLQPTEVSFSTATNSHPHRRTRRVWTGCPSWRRGGGALSGEYAYTWCTTALASFNISIYLATPPLAHLSTCTGRGPDLCPTLGGGYKKGTLRHPGASCRGVGGHHAVSLKPLLSTSPAGGFYRCLFCELFLFPFCRNGAENSLCRLSAYFASSFSRPRL